MQNVLEVKQSEGHKETDDKNVKKPAAASGLALSPSEVQFVGASTIAILNI
jgi:hypothetical protein